MQMRQRQGLMPPKRLRHQRAKMQMAAQRWCQQTSRHARLLPSTITPRRLTCAVEQAGLVAGCKLACYFVNRA